MATDREWYAANKERHNAANRARYRAKRTEILAAIAVRRAAEPEKAKAVVKAWVDRNKERRAATGAAWSKKNRPRRAKSARRWRENHPQKARAEGARYRAAKCKAVPKWANAKAIEEFYRLAAEITAETGIPHHVDHVVPLRSRYVCGLHWEGNLQVMPGSENCAKSAKFEPGAPIIVSGDIPWLR